MSTWTGLDRARYTFWEKLCNRSFIIINEKSFGKKNFEINAQGKKCQNGKVAIFLPNSHFGIFSLCIDFKNLFCQMTSLSLSWKTYYTIFPKKCLWTCPGLSMYSSGRINWIISSFPRWISKILFDLVGWDNFEGLGCKSGTGFFFCYLTFWKNTVVSKEFASLYQPTFS